MKHKPRYGVTLRQTTLRLAEALYGSFEEWIQALYDDGIWELELSDFVTSRGFSSLEFKVVSDLVLKKRDVAWRPADMPLISESIDSYERWGRLHRCLRDWGTMTNWAACMLRNNPTWGRKQLIVYGVGLGMLEEEVDGAWISLPDDSKIGRSDEYKLTARPTLTTSSANTDDSSCRVWVTKVVKLCPRMRPDLIEKYGEAHGKSRDEIRAAFKDLGIDIEGQDAG